MVGSINKNQNRIVLFYGSITTGLDDPPDEDAVFEIGSLSNHLPACLL